MTKISPCLALLCFQMHGLTAPSLLPRKQVQLFYETSHFALFLFWQCRTRRASEHFIITAHLVIFPLTFIEVSSLSVDGRHVLVTSQYYTSTHLLRSMYKDPIVCRPPTYLQPCLPRILRSSILCL